VNAVPRVVEVRVPDMGNFNDVAVIDVLVKPGDTIEPETPLVTLETEKATMDVPSTVGGVVEQVAVKKGGRVSTGDVVITVRSDGAGDGANDTAAAKPNVEQPAAPQAPASGAQSPVASGGAAPASGGAQPIAPSSQGSAATARSGAQPATAPQAAGAAASAAKPAAPAAGNGATQAASPAAGPAGAIPLIDEPGFSRAYASPSVRKFARELGVDLSKVNGTGFKSRITHDDVKGFVKKQMAGGAPATARAPSTPGPGGGLPKLPVVDYAAFGPVESKPLSRIQKISGARLQASWVNIPHVTQFDEADITELEETRNKLKKQAAEQGIKLTPLAFIMRACIKALQEFPTFNASLDASGENLILKKYMHLGFAADTPNGLLVPVVHDANRKDIYELARATAELSEKARDGKLGAAQMQGGCFTISSLGGIGGTAFTPIINAPEVAILGVSRSAMKPVWKDGQFVPRLMLPLSLSYDHRVIDGALAVRFTTYLTQALADVRGLLEAVP
jgi:pyruvate dehydrogenase E2 component (dihydrolipoamide acetyltransferase)